MKREDEKDLPEENLQNDETLDPLDFVDDPQQTFSNEAFSSPGGDDTSTDFNHLISHFF